MGKYDPLTSFLERQNAEYITMKFNEIEDIISEKLPRSAHIHRAWWANEDNPSRQSYSWLSTGYKTVDVEPALELVRFERQWNTRALPEQSMTKNDDSKPVTLADYIPSEPDPRKRDSKKSDQDRLKALKREVWEDKRTGSTGKKWRVHTKKRGNLFVVLFWIAMLFGFLMVFGD